MLSIVNGMRIGAVCSERRGEINKKKFNLH